MRKKSELEKWLDEYYEVFRWNYPLNIVSMKSETEIIDDIKECIRLGKKANPEKYRKDVDY